MSIARMMLAVPFLFGGVALANEAQHERTGDRAGMERTPTVLQKDVKDKLGDGWIVERKGEDYIAKRATTQAAGSDFQNRVDNQIQSLEKDHAGLTARMMGEEIRLNGYTEKCGDVASEANDFAKINGVNRIRISATCNK